MADFYGTATALREVLGVDDAILPDDDAEQILLEASDLIDERLGVWPVDPATGRKIVAADLAESETWRLTKLAEATIEVARVIFSDPDVARRQRAKFTSGDVSVSGFYGPAFGERCAALLNQSGLKRNVARMSGSRHRVGLSRHRW